MNFKWIVLFCLVTFVVFAESKKTNKKSKDKNQVENTKSKEYVGKKEANSEPSQNKEVNPESKQTKEKYKKSKEYQTKSNEYVKDEKKQNNKKFKREVQEEPAQETLKVEEPVLSENVEPEEVAEIPVEIVEEPVVKPKKSKNEPSKKTKNDAKSEKVKQKPKKPIQEGDCPGKEEKVHVQSEACYKENQNNVVEEVEVAEESA